MTIKYSKGSCSNFPYLTISNNHIPEKNRLAKHFSSNSNFCLVEIEFFNFWTLASGLGAISAMQKFEFDENYFTRSFQRPWRIGIWRAHFFNSKNYPRSLDSHTIWAIPMVITTVGFLFCAFLLSKSSKHDSN